MLFVTNFDSCTVVYDIKTFFLRSVLRYKQQNYLLKQFITCFSRVLKNREKEVIIPPPDMGHPLEVSTQKKRESIHSIKNAIGNLILLAKKNLHFILVLM